MGIAYFHAIPTEKLRPFNPSFPARFLTFILPDVFGRVPASFFRRLPRPSGYDLKSTEKQLDFPSRVFISKCGQNHAMTSATGFCGFSLPIFHPIIDDELWK